MSTFGSPDKSCQMESIKNGQKEFPKMPIYRIKWLKMPISGHPVRRLEKRGPVPKCAIGFQIIMWPLSSSSSAGSEYLCSFNSGYSNKSDGGRQLFAYEIIICRCCCCDILFKSLSQLWIASSLMLFCIFIKGWLNLKNFSLQAKGKK